jgi:hypothetical protein
LSWSGGQARDDVGGRAARRVAHAGHAGLVAGHRKCERDMRIGEGHAGLRIQIGCDPRERGPGVLRRRDAAELGAQQERARVGHEIERRAPGGADTRVVQRPGPRAIAHRERSQRHVPVQVAVHHAVA